jgi:hypothetical protein
MLLAGGDAGLVVGVGGAPTGATWDADPAGMSLTGGDAGLVLGVVAAPAGAAADGVIDLEPHPRETSNRVGARSTPK